ncbi:MAG TPA: MarR family transcriptional regulator [Dehalococcoidia bacterium]|nr:MarR family transcriptional regulator [Dehalococcoidia bacterium]
MSVEHGPRTAPPTFLQLAGQPLRWQVLRELARSDRQVRELTRVLGQPQSLVSYHLGRLRAGHLVSMRRSSFDGRDAYYRVDLARCREGLAEAGGALHPGLAFVPPPAETCAARGRSVRVLFLCTGNSTRSQIAEAMLQHLTGDAQPAAVEAYSAGTQPRSVHQNAVKVMRERGIDISSKRSKHLSRFARRRFDYVVTLCDRVREVCPEFPGGPERSHWSIADPALEGGTDEESYPAFQRTAAEIENRVHFMLSVIRQQTARR